MSTDLRTELNDADSATNWVSDGASPGLNTDTGQRYEGTGSIDGQHTNSDEATYTTSIGGTRDLSDATVYFLVKDNLLETYANGGMQGMLFDGTDRIGYDIGGNDAPGLDLEPYYRGFKMDVSVVSATPGGFATYAGTEANMTFTAITGVGVGTLHLAKAVGNVPNIFIDRMTFIANGSYALRVNGGTSGTPETTSDLQGDDQTNGWGMVGQPKPGQFDFFAPTEWGEPAANADVYFTASDEQWFWIGDNNGGRQIGATHFPFRIVGNATDTIDVKWTNVVIVNTGTDVEFTAGDANVNVMQFDNVTFTDLGTITFTTQSAGNRFANDCTFNNCDQVYLSTMDMDGNTFNGSKDALGAIEWDASSDEENQDNLTFNSDGTGHAIEINLNTAGATTFNIDGYVFDGFAGQDGTAGNRVFYINNPADGDITINLTNCSALNQVGTGSGFSFELAAGTTSTVTINQTVTLTVTVVDSDGNPIQGARVRIENGSTGALVTQGSTNASGIYSDATYNYAADLGVLTKVRLKGYKNFRTAGTITNTGISVGVTLQDDPVVYLP